MNTNDQNRVTMLTTLAGVIENHEPTWTAHVAFKEGYNALTTELATIGQQDLLAQGNPGAANAKELARKSLSDAASEVIGAVRAYAAVNADPELAARVEFSPSSIVSGKANEVVTRCRAVHATATGVLAALADYGFTAAKLTMFKKKIDAFDALKSAPRQSQVTQSAAAQLLPQLVRGAVAIARDQLDGLVLQFKGVNPTFYEEYFAARIVVDSRGSRPDNTDAQPAPTPTPTPTPVPA